MSTPLWGHKPPAVRDCKAFWGGAPPEPSERAVYWVRRLREGSWLPNRRLRVECGDCQASMLGVWIWEARRAFIPLEEMLAGTPLERIAVEAARWSDDLPGPYWVLLEERSRPAGVLGDAVAGLAAAMVAAVRPPLTPRERLVGRWV